jgi:hypothetical protein
LDTSLRLEAVLDAAVAANQPEVHVDYVDYISHQETPVPSTYRVALNSNNDVTILAAPTASPKREVLRASVYNKDTAVVGVTVKTDDGTTERILYYKQIAPKETLQYVKGVGWFREAVV